MTAPRIELLEALEVSGEFSMTAARSIRGTYASRRDHASAIAHALQMDVFNVDSAQDRFTINHKHSTSKQIKEARERSDWRNGISANLNAISEEHFQAIVTALAECRGAEKSDEWRRAAVESAEEFMAYAESLAASTEVATA